MLLFIKYILKNPSFEYVVNFAEYKIIKKQVNVMICTPY